MRKSTIVMFNFLVLIYLLSGCSSSPDFSEQIEAETTGSVEILETEFTDSDTKVYVDYAINGGDGTDIGGVIENDDGGVMTAVFVKNGNEWEMIENRQFIDRE